MKTFLSVVLIVLSVACVYGKPPTKSKVAIPVKFIDCGSKIATVTAVTVTPCDKDPCTLHKGKNSTISIEFTVNKDAPNITEATSVVHGIIEGVKVPFPLTNSNACKDCGLKCPLVAGKSYTYAYSLPISSLYPSVQCAVQWEIQTTASLKSKAKQLETNSLMGNSETDVACIQIAVQVSK